MDRLPKISIRLHGGLPPSECVELSRAAEAASFSSVWFAENAFARGILPSAAACAIATKRVQIGAGVFNPFSRHPTMMAMEVGALDELSHGRTILSIGAGIMSALQKIGFNAEKPLTALRDTIAIVRGLLRGEQIDYAGPTFSAKNVKLDYRTRPDIPIYVAGRGDLTVKLAGEAADGLVISNMCSVRFSGRIAELMQSARRAARLAGQGEVVQYMTCAIHADRAAAIRAAKNAVGEMLPGYWALGQKLATAKEGLLAGTEISDAEFSTTVAKLRAGQSAVDVLDERFTRAFSLAGTPDECLAGALTYGSAGVTELALTFSGPTATSDIRMMGDALVARGQGRRS
jgi:5,10-methylenetetrahydromethanopterin reductase